MTDKENNDRLVWSFRRYFIIFFTVLVGGIITRIVRPYYHAYRIRQWIRTEPHYIQDYSVDIGWLADFRFELDPYGEYTIVIENIQFEAPVRIAAERQFDPGLLATLSDRDRDRRRLQTEIESVLTNTPGVFIYLDANGEQCAFEDAERLLLEYRIYPDGLSQHELMSGITSIASALTYVDERESKLMHQLREQV